MPGKRKSTLTYNQRFKRARMQMRTRAGYRRMLSRNLPARFGGKTSNFAIVTRVNNLYRMIETKELSWKTGTNVSLVHNVLQMLNNSAGSVLNIFQAGYGNTAPESQNTGSRVGDNIAIKGVMIRGMLENALARPKTYYRIMLLKGAKGETFSSATVFKNDSNNKMIDQVNTDRFTIVAQKVLNVTASNVAASGAEVPSGAPIIATAGGIGTKTFKMWIPGAKFGRNGVIQYEDNTNQPKFFDYRICVLAYDWFGTPETSVCGKINELYTKTYFKDA